MKQRDTVFVAIGVAMTAVCVAANLGGAWYGDPANGFQLVLTALYIVFWTVFCILPAKRPVYAKTAFFVALLTFFSGVCCTLYKLTNLKIFFPLGLCLCAFTGVPFYGLRFFTGWTELYTAAGVIAAVWLFFAGKGLRTGQRVQRS